MRVASVCPRCGALVPAGARCPRCAKAAPEPSRRDGAGWRAGYGTSGYRRARQLAIERAGGRCERCGRVAALRAGETWVTEWLGEVHHVTPLSAGGTNDAGNLCLLCTRCHHETHEEGRRAADGRRG